MTRIQNFATSLGLLAAGFALAVLTIGSPAAPAASATPAATGSAIMPAYCTKNVTVIRAYAYNVPAGADMLRSGVAGHGGKLTCITLSAGNYAKTIELNTSTGGWVIPPQGLGAFYFNCLPGVYPGFRWTPSGLPYNDCAEEFAQGMVTPDGGLKTTWPDYNGTPMFPPATP